MDGDDSDGNNENDSDDSDLQNDIDGDTKNSVSHHTAYGDSFNSQENIAREFSAMEVDSKTARPSASMPACNI